MNSRAIALAAALALLAFGTARASSDAAWAQFSRDVETKCSAAVGGQIARPRVVVDPTGSEHYGLALVSGTRKGSKSAVTFICVYDKQEHTAEIGSELGADMVRVPAKTPQSNKAK